MGEKTMGGDLMKSTEKLFKEFFFKIRNQDHISNKFQKHMFRFLDSHYNGKTVIVYFGEKEAYEGLPHGNRKKTK